MTREHSMKAPALPRVLLVEDDPVSRAYLAAATASLPAAVDAADTLAAALALADLHAYDLWLIDARLPDGDGPALLQRLRERAPGTPALAHTAARGHDELDVLIAAGFAEVLVKPLDAASLHAALRRVLRRGVAEPVLPAPPCGKLPVWDDDAAASAMHGNRDHVAALRELFLAELRAQRDSVLRALQVHDDHAAHAQLHRLRASCGFVGAARLGAAVRRLQDAPHSLPLRADFEHAVADVLGSA